MMKKTNTDKSAQVNSLRPIPANMHVEIMKETGKKNHLLRFLAHVDLCADPVLASKTLTRFLIHTRDDTKVIRFDEVVYCIADSNYTCMYLSDGSKVMVSKTLKAIETILSPPNFIRIHASNLINFHFIKRILLNHQCKVELPNHVMLDVSRSRREELMQKVETL